jgi:hypothetical protein
MVSWCLYAAMTMMQIALCDSMMVLLTEIRITCARYAADWAFAWMTRGPINAGSPWINRPQI